MKNIISFLERVISMFFAFCLGCYMTATYLDPAFVKQQKEKFKTKIYSIILSEDSIL